MGLRLNLGCGEKRIEGFINVDKCGDPDVLQDLEVFPWPWEGNSVSHILLNHVLEHLGRDPDVFLRIMQEMYRVCEADASIRILVPHFRHDFFYGDPTHVRAVTPLGLSLFSKRQNQQWISQGVANTPLAIYLDVDFELVGTRYTPSEHWYRLHPERPADLDLLLQESALYNNLIEQIEMDLRVVK